MFVKLRIFLRDLWTLVRPYWSSDEKWAARGLLAIVIALGLGTVFVTVEINKWQALFYNALEARDQAQFMRLIGTFSMLALAYIAMAVYQLYLTQMLQIRWRRWLTARYLERWLNARVYYRMQLMDRARRMGIERFNEIPYGTEPSARIASWKCRWSKLEPSFSSASRRCRRICGSPSL